MINKKRILIIVSILVLVILSTCLIACKSEQYEVAFDANGGVGEMATLTNKVGATTIPANTFIKSGYTFVGWATSTAGEVICADEGSIDVTGDITLYAIWQQIKYEVAFDANGGVGEMATLTNKVGATTIPANTFIKSGYTFVGWATSTAGEVICADEGSIDVTGDITLYAIWKLNFAIEVNATQAAVNSQNVKVVWSNANKDISRIVVETWHYKDLIDTKEITNRDEILNGETIVSAHYGLFDVITKIYSVEDDDFQQYSQRIGITSDHYTIAFFNATFPVSLFTLMFEDKDSTNINSTDDIFIYLDRPAAYDWTKLPENLHKVPVANPGVTYFPARDAVKIWVKELYDLNNDSHFTLYFTDNLLYPLCSFFVINKIPTINYDVIMFSDGTATASFINRYYSGENGEEKFNELQTSWTNFLNSDNPSYDMLWEDVSGYSAYAPVIISLMDNIKWYTGRLRVGENVINTPFTTSLINLVKSRGLKEFYLNSLLAALTIEEKENFKELYHIDEDTFKVAEERNKKVMMILGTSWSDEEETFEDYIRMTIATYGDDYVYYYKPHPGYPTANWPARHVILEKLNEEGYDIIELEAAVAAEFFLFFFENIEMVGYASTTFASVNDKNGAGVFGQPTTYNVGLLESYFNVATKENLEASYGIILNDGDVYYIVEFFDEMSEDKDIGIYNATTKILTFYKNNDGTYVIV